VRGAAATRRVDRAEPRRGEPRRAPLGPEHIELRGEVVVAPLQAERLAQRLLARARGLGLPLRLLPALRAAGERVDRSDGSGRRGCHSTPLAAREPPHSLFYPFHRQLFEMGTCYFTYLCRKSGKMSTTLPQVLLTASFSEDFAEPPVSGTGTAVCARLRT
jgi:hypothetical protein